MPIKPLRKPSWRRQRRRLPFSGAPHDYHRAARRIGAGWRPSDVARLLSCDPLMLHELLRQPEFVMLVKGYRDLAHAPREARLQRLADIALLEIEEALFEGDAGVKAFVRHELLAKRDPSMTLAERLLDGLEREKRTVAFVQDARDTGTTWPDPEPSPPRPPADPAVRRVYRAAAKLKAGMVDEHSAGLESLKESEESDRTPPLVELVAASLPQPMTAVGSFMAPIDFDPLGWAWPEGP